jgi:acyl dehydratase
MASFHEPRGVYVGRDMGGHDYEVTAAAIERYAAGTADDGSPYRADSPLADAFGGAIAPALLYHSEVYTDLGWYLPNIFGNLHARQEWEIFHPMRVGETVRTRSTVVERYRKRNRDYVVDEVVIADASGRWLQRSRTHQSFLVQDDRSGFAVDREREKRGDRKFAIGEGPGPDLEPLSRTIDQAMCDAFSGPHRNYHNDRELAQALGFPDIVVQGMMSICFVAELMTRAHGAGWFCGGKLDVSLVNVVWGGDALAVRGRVREELPEGDHTRVVCDVWCEKPDGVKTLVGTASGLR